MNYQRIISLAPSITESIFALNAENMLVGRTDYCNFPLEANLIESIGGFITPDLEKIKSLKPDLLIATSTHNKDELKKIEKFGISVKIVKTENIFDSPQALKDIGEWTGKTGLASELSEKLSSELNGLLTLCEKIKEIRRVYYLCMSGNYCSWKNNCTTTKLIKIAGGKHIKLTNLNFIESIVKGNPEIIIIPYSKEREEWKESMEFIENEKGLHKTDAFKNNTIRSIKGELLLRPGPRSAIGFRQLIEAIHPEIFE